MFFDLCKCIQQGVSQIFTSTSKILFPPIIQIKQFKLSMKMGSGSLWSQCIPVFACIHKHEKQYQFTYILYILCFIYTYDIKSNSIIGAVVHYCASERRLL